LVNIYIFYQNALAKKQYKNEMFGPILAHRWAFFPGVRHELYKVQTTFGDSAFAIAWLS
jgi:hypothetical protein